jgi:hypothetical protein
MFDNRVDDQNGTIDDFLLAASVANPRALIFAPRSERYEA